MRRLKMKSQVKWLPILFQCKENVKAKIHKHLKIPIDQQSDLGKGAGGDIIKPVDLAAEKAIVEVLHQHLVSFTLISEESGVQEFGKTPSKYFVTIDPIDGTTNFVRGLPFYASSIALSTSPILSSVFAGLVTDLFHDVTYYALEGSGAFREQRKIVTSSRPSLDKAVIGLDLNSYKVQGLAFQLTKLIQKTKHIRHLGANALELCYVADGTTDAFVDIRGKLRMTDIAAAFLIVKEAGGILTNPTGSFLDVQLDPKQTVTFIASGNTQIHKNILNLVKTKC
jgi:myo-inositol-1(or 4)-monophosphatase